MNSKTKKMLCAIFIIFILINIFMNNQVFASSVKISNKSVARPVATIIKSCIAFAQVFVSGFFTIRFTISGIQYFTAVAATDKADNKNRMKNNLVLGVLTYLGMYAFGKVLGL